MLETPMKYVVVGADEVDSNRTIDGRVALIDSDGTVLSIEPFDPSSLSNTADDGTINADEELGSWAQGQALDEGQIDSSGPGSFAQGYATSAGTIVSEGKGTFAQGIADTTGTLTAVAEGSTVHGSVGQGSTIKTESYGSTAQGYSTSGSDIHTGPNYGGHFASGRAQNGGEIYAHGYGGAFASGYANGANSKIDSSGAGSIASGWAYGGGVIEATANGSVASGYASGGTRRVTASGQGSFAQGKANTASVVASGVNAVQLGPGTNSIDDSVRVGSGIRLFGKVALPAVLANGDVWLDTDGFVKIRSNGVTVSIAP